MKKIQIIAIIGSDRAFRKSDCPIHNGDDTYDSYFREMTMKGTIVVPKDIYDTLPDKSPPFPCRPTVVISETGFTAELGTRNVCGVRSLAELFEMLPEDGKAVSIIVNNEVYTALFEHYKEHIDSVIVAEIAEPYAVSDNEPLFDPPSQFEWRSLQVVSNVATGRLAAYTIMKYTRHDLDI